MVKTTFAVVLFLTLIFLFNQIENLISLMKKECPEILKEYGNPSSAKDAYFMYSFLIMDGYKSEKLPDSVESKATNVKKSIMLSIVASIGAIIVAIILA
tara:strand:- start:171 stop:467 length:297 start_codon:yes stop_codon:yes gene_type:complete